MRSIRRLLNIWLGTRRISYLTRKTAQRVRWAIIIGVFVFVCFCLPLCFAIVDTTLRDGLGILPTRMPSPTAPAITPLPTGVPHSETLWDPAFSSDLIPPAQVGG